jgi:hypothetical protein
MPLSQTTWAASLHQLVHFVRRHWSLAIAFDTRFPCYEGDHASRCSLSAKTYFLACSSESSWYSCSGECRNKKPNIESPRQKSGGVKKLVENIYSVPCQSWHFLLALSRRLSKVITTQILFDTHTASSSFMETNVGPASIGKLMYGLNFHFHTSKWGYMSLAEGKSIIDQIIFFF